MAPLDELLLAEAREAQAAQAHTQAQADLARARFADAVRRLHQGGASMREIARAFGLSHQRVHQLVDRRGWPCSFCGALQEDRVRLIAGPGVRICNRCVGLASRLLAGDARARRRWAGLEPDPAERGGKRRTAADCSFCGKRPDQVDGVATGPVAAICTECLALCREIVAEKEDGA